MTDSRNPHVGIEALLTPQNSVLLLIDHQPFQFANLHSHEPTLIVNNVAGLAKTAKGFQVPTILTTVLEERGRRAPDQRRPRRFSRSKADQHLHQRVGR